MYIAFEGIDGSGKTTFGQIVADELRRQGYDVVQTRKAAGFATPLATELRELSRDVRYLGMSKHVETLLGAAREAELLDACVRRELAAGKVVIADRSLYTTLVQAVWGRGLDREAVTRILEFVSGGLWPDLVVYCDVDPATSRLRRRIQKIRSRRTGDPGRKGYAGLVLRERMREGYRALALEDPTRWCIIDNAAATREQAAHAACAAVAGKLGLPVERLSLPVSAPRETIALEQAEEWFYRRVREIAEDDPPFAAYLLLNLDDPRAHELRIALADIEPAMIAFSVQGIASPDSMRIRYRLAPREPQVVAESLGGLDDDDSFELRRALAAEAPREVAASLRGIDTRLANRLREALVEDAPDGVLEGLGRLDNRFAWELREALGRAHAEALARSLRGLDTARAWEIRRDLLSTCPAAVLESIDGLPSEDAWALRRDWVDRAPKAVILSIAGLSSEPSWEIRARAAALGKELLDSVRGLEDERAWALREEHRKVWPHTAVGSVGPLVTTPRGEAFVRRELAEHPGDLMVVRKTVAILGKPRVRAERGAEAIRA